MISARNFRKKIKSAKNIAKITRAMQMVAASKMRKAQDQAKSSRSYSDGISELSSMLYGQIDPDIHPLLGIKNMGIKELVIVVGSEKGLCGGMLTGLSRYLLNLYPETDNLDFVTVGRKAKNVVNSVWGKIVAEFPLGLSQPKFEIVPPVSRFVSEKYINGDYKKITIIFMSFINTMLQEPMAKTLLPLSPAELLRTEPRYTIEPSAEAISTSLLSMYLEVEIYQFFLEAYASEQSARMVAMKNATDNAQQLISDLTLEYNKARQANITAEIIDSRAII